MAGAQQDDGTEQITLRLREEFLEQIDEEWQRRGFNSRSEYIRYVLRDALEVSTFDRDELLALALGERELREGETMSAEEARERFGSDE